MITFRAFDDNFARIRAAGNAPRRGLLDLPGLTLLGVSSEPDSRRTRSRLECVVEPWT